MPDRPNVLVLVDDEHRPDVLGYAGDDVVRTRTLDWLAETGTVFENAYTPSPVCVPARHSMRTGKLPRTFARDGFDAFESHDYPTLPLQLARHGYMTASGGKEHYPGWNQHQGWRKRIGPTPMKQHGVGAGQVPDAAPGAFEGQGRNWKWSAAKEIRRAGVGDARTQVQDRRATEGVEQYVREFFTGPYYDRAQPGTPLCLKLSLIEPHYPYFADEERFEYYLNRVDPYVEGGAQSPRDGERRSREPGDLHPVVDTAAAAGESTVVRPGEDVSPREIRRATAAYYAMVERVDDLFGRVLDALEHHGEDVDDWVVVFASDHGEMLGERGLWGKGQFLDPSARVPLVIRYPRRFDPGTVEENVSLCDIYATVCDLAGVPAPDGLDSRSLVGLMEGDTDRWHSVHDNEAVSQDVGNSAVVDGVGTDHLMVKRDGLKYCYYGEDHPELLLDLDRDPGETTNVAGDPAYADALAAFRERRAELGYGPDADPGYTDAGYQ
ncbi:MAG: sulfatase-like hydrolase/transferase [Halobacteriaceae archaeon]